MAEKNLVSSGWVGVGGVRWLGGFSLSLGIGLRRSISKVKTSYQEHQEPHDYVDLLTF